MSVLVRCGVILFVFLSIPFVTHGGNESDVDEGQLGNSSLEEPAYKELGNSTRFMENPLEHLQKRDLKIYYSRRAYPGAPPFIPHKVASDMADSSNSCRACHKKGGYMPTREAYVPVTPHPDYLSCRQCHVPQMTEALFRENDWKTVAPPKIGRPALPGSPPPIPHTMQLRENCAACHTGSSAVFAIHSPHPERTSCTQCHVPQKTDGIFVRGSKK